MLYDVKTSIYAGLSQFLTSTNEEITLEEFENGQPEEKQQKDFGVLDLQKTRGGEVEYHRNTRGLELKILEFHWVPNCIRMYLGTNSRSSPSGGCYS